jgi:hypothetical protein
MPINIIRQKDLSAKDELKLITDLMNRSDKTTFALSLFSEGKTDDQILTQLAMNASFANVDTVFVLTDSESDSFNKQRCLFHDNRLVP